MAIKFKEIRRFLAKNKGNTAIINENVIIRKNN